MGCGQSKSEQSDKTPQDGGGAKTETSEEQLGANSGGGAGSSSMVRTHPRAPSCRPARCSCQPRDCHVEDAWGAAPSAVRGVPARDPSKRLGRAVWSCPGSKSVDHARPWRIARVPSAAAPQSWRLSIAQPPVFLA